MLIRAPCLAAAAVLLCLNLASCFSRGGSYYQEDPYYSPINRPHSSLRRFGGRSSADEEMVSDGSDMQLTLKQYRQLYYGQEVHGRAFARRKPVIPWTDGLIPFWFDDRYTFEAEQKEWILRGMRNWEKYTCVTFRPVNESDSHYLAIWKGGGCFAGLGMNKKGAQAVSLPDTCYYRTSIEHELGHTLGLMHEHQRWNRDDYLWVNDEALISSGDSQLRKYNVSGDKFGLPYDYDSVMHYDKTAYTREWGRQTIYPKLVSKTDVIGNAMVLSFYDIKLVNLMYKCKDRCHRRPYCREPCFVNEKCQCFCKKDAPKEVCKDKYPECAQRAAHGDCESHSRSMLQDCRLSCGMCKLDGTAPQIPCLDWDYGCNQNSCKQEGGRRCKNTCNVCPDYNKQPPCMDTLRDCERRHSRGECGSNPDMMLRKCTKTCGFCFRRRIYRNSYYPFY